jgi:hypothetical protein
VLNVPADLRLLPAGLHLSGHIATESDMPCADPTMPLAIAGRFVVFADIRRQMVSQ